MAKDRIFGEDVKKEETHAQSFLKTIVYSLNPGKYPILAQRTWRQALAYMLTIVFFLVFILFIVSIVKYAQVQYGLDSELDKFENLTVDVDYSLKAPIQYGHFLIVDNERNYTGEDILITQDGITSRSLLCLLLSPACILDKDPVLRKASDLKDVLRYRDTLRAYAALFLVLMLPGLLMLFLIFYTLKFSLIVTVAACIAFIVTRLARFQISAKQIFLAAIYASTVLVLLEILTYYMMRFYLVPMVAYIVMYTVCIMLIGEREHAYAKER
jgi:uncharacterized membrane protein YhaH (DUF805 family)